MMRSTFLLMLCVGISYLDCRGTNNFVISKKNPQKKSMNKLKENYADELAELIRSIPRLHKQLADLQGKIIAELDDLINDTMQLGKVELDARIGKAHELGSCLESTSCNLSTKSVFLKDKKLITS